MAYAYVELEFKTGFTSYSPVLNEGYLDSTTLQAALVAVEAELLGRSKPVLLHAKFTSLLPLAEAEEGLMPLLPPLRLPTVGERAWGFWTLKAANYILEVLAKCRGEIVLAYDADKDLYSVQCIDGGAVRVQGYVVYNSDKMLFSALGEDVSFLPPLVRSDRHKLIVDRLTGAATPYMIKVVEPRRTYYWFAAYLPEESCCSILEKALGLLGYIGLGAYRSAGLGRISVREYRCGPINSLPRALLKGKEFNYMISLGLLVPRDGCVIRYGRSVLFGSYRGYGGRAINFRRPLVVAAAPGSIVKAGCTGIVVSSSAAKAGNEQPILYAYSFDPLFYPISQ